MHLPYLKAFQTFLFLYLFLDILWIELQVRFQDLSFLIFLHGVKMLKGFKMRACAKIVMLMVSCGWGYIERGELNCIFINIKKVCTISWFITMMKMMKITVVFLKVLIPYSIKSAQLCAFKHFNLFFSFLVPFQQYPQRFLQRLLVWTLIIRIWIFAFIIDDIFENFSSLFLRRLIPDQFNQVLSIVVLTLCYTQELLILIKQFQFEKINEFNSAV